MGHFSRFGRYETAFKICFGHGLLISHQVVGEQPNDRLILQVRRGIVLFYQSSPMKKLVFHCLIFIVFNFRMFSNLVWTYGEWRMHGKLKPKALCVLFPFPKVIWSIQFSLAMTKITSSFTTATRLVLKSYRHLLWTSPGPSTLSITVAVLSTRAD